MNGLILSAFLQFGILSGGSVIYDPPANQQLIESLPCYSEIGFKAEYGVFFADTSIRTDMMPSSAFDWQPNQVAFEIGGGLKYKAFTFGIKHTCYHPITTYMVWEGYKVIPRFEGATNDIYIRFDIKQK